MCWKDPSTLRLSRPAPASASVAAPLIAIPARPTITIGHGETCGGEMSLRIAA